MLKRPSRLQRMEKVMEKTIKLTQNQRDTMDKFFSQFPKSNMLKESQKLHTLEKHVNKTENITHE